MNTVARVIGWIIGGFLAGFGLSAIEDIWFDEEPPVHVQVVPGEGVDCSAAPKGDRVYVYCQVEAD